MTKPLEKLTKTIVGPDAFGAGADGAPIAMPDTPTELAVAEYHACARLRDGSVACWGTALRASRFQPRTAAS